MKRFLLSAAALLLLSPVNAAAADVKASSCVACHGDANVIDDEAMRRIVTSFADDVHAQVGLSCQDCHGGNPDPELAEDMLAAMDDAFAPNPYRGAPKRADVPALCGRCHSNFEFMRRFRPDARVDQEADYWTSRHGQLLKDGDEKVATCIDCHGVHGIRRPADPESKVYPAKVAETCGGCHADAARMAGRVRANGTAMPVDQLPRWQRSVHAQAMLEKGDLSAPTCNDCHGNHGAKPPEVESVAMVCGRCHGREATLFRASAKRTAFEEHEELMADATACGDCHSDPEPQAKLTRHSFPECVTCHGNHSVMRPTVAMLAPLPATPCAFCHEGPASVEVGTAEPARKRKSYEAMRDSLLASAQGQKIEGDALFDWMVDRARELPTHTVEQLAEDGSRELRPEFNRLFSKFRIGKISFSYLDPATGKEAHDHVTRCSDCHSAEPVSTDEAKGFETGRAFLERTRELTELTARAERALLTARRGGVETREALLDLDQAVDSQIELQVLVHTFSHEAGGAFEKKQLEGVGHAKAAMAAATEAMGELTVRRRGLILALVFIGLVLVGLAMKIRQLPQ